MEERAGGSKEKKYVLYTVVGEEKERAGLGVWVVRVLLATLLLIALAVVPYVSLRLAQVNDRTLVVFQPVLVHNRSKDHHHVAAKSVHNQRPGSVGAALTLKSDSLIKDSHAGTTEDPPDPSSNRTQRNSTIITLHEAAVTLSLLEDTSNGSKLTNSSLEQAILDHIDTELPEDTNVTTSSPPVTKSEPQDTSSSPLTLTSTKPQLMENVSKETVTEPSSTEHPSSTPKGLVVASSALPISSEDTTTTSTHIPVTDNATVSTTSPKPTARHPVLQPAVTHNLAYVATASSGNHVGGVCIWKTNTNITNWSFFYDNIPIEYQSHQDAVDHELRGMLVAVRLWSDLWYDYHVVLRSQNQAINGSKHPTYEQLLEEIENRSTNHFTYELEWRLRRDDSLVGMAYSLSRLYKDYKYWMHHFSQRVEGVLGVQGPEPITSKRQNIPQKLFVTKDTQLPKGIGDLRSVDLI